MSRITSLIEPGVIRQALDRIFPFEATEEVGLASTPGVQEARKSYVVYEGRHILLRTQLIRESLDWLDRYLGPVK